MIWPRLLPRLDLALLLAMATAWAISHRQGLDVAAIEAAVGDMGAWAPLAYISLFALAAVLFVPGSILSLAGGGLFGPVWGKAYALLGATVGATLAFLAARYLASDWVVATAGGRLKQLAEGVEAEGWRFIAFVRLVALFPFNLVNYALGLTRVRLLDYSLASLVSMAPGAIAYTYLGCAGREAVAGGDALVQKGLMALGLVALLAFFPRVVRRLRSYSFTWLDAAQLPERIGNGAALMIIDVRGPDEFNGELGHLGGGRKHPDRRASSAHRRPRSIQEARGGARLPNEDALGKGGGHAQAGGFPQRRRAAWRNGGMEPPAAPGRERNGFRPPKGVLTLMVGARSNVQLMHQ